MFQHYLKVAARNLLRRKGLALINILGLSIGLACFLLFLLFAVHEFSFDRFHQNGKQIYRFAEWINGIPGQEPGGQAFGGTPAGPALKSDHEDVKDYVRIQTGFGENFIRVGDKVGRSTLSFADPQLFQVFTFPLLHGNATTALKDQRSVVLTREKAMQFFGETSVVGRRIDIKVNEQFEPFVVGGVAEDIPSNSSIRFHVLGHFQYLMSTPMGKHSEGNWHMTIGSETYVLLHENSKLPGDPNVLKQFRNKYYPGEAEALVKEGIWNGKGDFPVRFILQPLHEVHTNPKIGGMPGTIDPKTVWILVSIAAAILLIACINFTTLAIGRSAGRAREVGIRKVTGSRKEQLVFQFLSESLLLSIFSAILGFALAQLLLPFFNQLSGRELHFSISHFPQLLWLFAGLTLLTGILAGIYLAFILSGFRPIEVLKSRIRLGGSNLFTRSLVTVQFVLSITLIISTLVILQQLNYMRSKHLGFNKENVVVVEADGTDAKRVFPLFRQEVQSHTLIAGISGSEIGLGEGKGFMGTAFDHQGEAKGVFMYPVDHHFLPTMGMQLVAGRNFDPVFAMDTVNSIVVNEALLRDFGLTASNAVGHVLKERRFGGGPMPRKIIGVVRNFHFNTLTEQVRPQMFVYPPQLDARKFFVRIKSGEPSKALAVLQSAWKSVVPDLPFQYSFLDEDADRFYRMEERWGKVAGWAGGISIFLACLGLFGLAALTAVNRTKEIGIRKVLGASMAHIIGLLSKDFLKLVLIAVVIAIPCAWYAMHHWLQEYAYRISLGWWVFALTGCLALLIAFLTISLQTAKTAAANPVRSLRTD